MKIDGSELLKEKGPMNPRHPIRKARGGRVIVAMEKGEERWEEAVWYQRAVKCRWRRMRLVEAGQ